MTGIGIPHTDETIARWRLLSQQLVEPHATTVDGVFARLLAVQAENPSQSAWAVAARTQHPVAAALEEALVSGRILRTHVLRPTWHYVGADDLDWLLALTGPRILPLFRRQLTSDLGLGAREVDRLGTAVLDLLATDPDRTRAEVGDALRPHLPRTAEGSPGRLTMLLMGCLEAQRLVVSGRPRAGEHTYARYEDRLRRGVGLDVSDREEALARLARRYFTGHGPATETDLAYWATLPITDVRRGRAAVEDELESFEHDGRTYWHAPVADTGRNGGPRGHLLQLLDEVYRGYQDSRMVLDARGVVPGGREKVIGMALVDGQMVAGMKRTVGATGVTFELAPFAPLSRVEQQVIDEAAERYGAFLGLPATAALAPDHRQ